MYWNYYLIIFTYYVLGTIGIWIINRKKEKQIARKSWIKHITYFLITSLVYLSIAFSPLVFHYIVLLIIIAGVTELVTLFHKSKYSHRLFFVFSLLVFALLSVGFYFFSDMDKDIILYTFLILCIFDGFSQVTGQLFGKRKLFPAISPGKTVEGLIGGSIIAVLSSLVFKNLVGESILKAFFTAFVISLFAFSGDAIKSVYKRKYHVKDFSNIIPGHGGFLDRFDSLIAAGAGVALLSLFMNF